MALTKARQRKITDFYKKKQKHLYKAGPKSKSQFKIKQTGIVLPGLFLYKTNLLDKVFYFFYLFNIIYYSKNSYF